nr:hypothetical protein [Tanacetum cinerariifolium]
MFTHDPKSAKVSKGLDSPNLQGRVNSLGSSIFTGISPWINADPLLPSSKLSTASRTGRLRYNPGIHLKGWFGFFWLLRFDVHSGSQQACLGNGYLLKMCLDGID